MTPSTIFLTALVTFSVTMMTTVHSANLPAEETGCTWRGQHYLEGEVFMSSPCVFCECSSGSVKCGQEDCPMPDCVEPVHLPGQCCPTCPRGPSCRGPGGKIIHLGQEVIVGGLSCMCEPSPDFFNAFRLVCEP